MSKRKILYIDVDRGVAIKEWVDILSQVVDVDTLIIGGTSKQFMPATLRVKEEKYGLPYFWRLKKCREPPFLHFHPVTKALLKLLPHSDYDGIITGEYGLGIPLYALRLQGMTGLFTHAINIFGDGNTRAQIETTIDGDYVAMFRPFHFITQLQSTANKLINVGHDPKKIHIVPTPVPEYPTKVVEKYDFSSVLTNYGWDNIKLINKLAKERNRSTWTVKTYGGKNRLAELSNVTHESGFLPRPQYYEWLASGRIGVQPQFLETFGTHIVEHAMFHPVMILKGTNFADDFTHAVQFDLDDFWRKAEWLLDSPELRQEVVERGREIIKKKFSFDNMKKGIDSFLDGASDTASRMDRILCLEKRPVTENVGAWFK